MIQRVTSDKIPKRKSTAGEMQQLVLGLEPDAAREYPKDRYDYHNGDVVAHLAGDTARFADLPDVVESLLDVVEHLDHRPEQDDQTDRCDQPPPGALQHGVCELDHLIDYCAVLREFGV
jgi:hypothetical protein